jgi:hypothetical protein
MVSFEASRSLKTTAATLVLVLVAAPFAGFAQLVLDPVANDEERQLVERIQREQSQHGPYSADLIDPLKTLALLYQERGARALAAETTERALQAVRANFGLHSLEQAPLLRQSIRNHEARGDFATAWDLEQELLSLAQRHPADLRTVPIFREIADKRMDLLERYRAGEFPPQIYLGCFYKPPEIRERELAKGSCRAGSRSVVIQSIVRDAQSNYESAVGALLRNRLYSSDELLELETELVRSSYKYGNYSVGRQSLRRLLSYEVANSEPLLSRMNALLRIADWELLFRKNSKALETYEEVYELLEEKGMAQTSIDEIFSPDVPIALPTFLPNPLVSAESGESSSGHIDVAFEVTKFGTTRRIEILDTTNATEAAADRLVRSIKLKRFRPRVTGGQLGNTPPIVVRCYVKEQR